MKSYPNSPIRRQNCQLPSLAITQTFPIHGAIINRPGFISPSQPNIVSFCFCDLLLCFSVCMFFFVCFCLFFYIFSIYNVCVFDCFLFWSCIWVCFLNCFFYFCQQPCISISFAVHQQLMLFISYQHFFGISNSLRIH